MMRAIRRCLPIALALAALHVSPAEPAATREGFAIPQPGRTFTFPRDHGSHPEFRIEWWYLTGHLWAEDGRRFGFQATFFRSAAPRAAAVATAPGDPEFRGDHVYLAHMALLDAASGRFVHQERLNRAGWDAFAAEDTLDVRNGPWSLRLDPADGSLRLRGSAGADAAFDLRLLPAKPLVVFGEDGVSRKGDDPAAASHYLTFTRLAATGRLDWEGGSSAVRGQAWMDHEFSSSQLDRDQTGWDWVSIQFHDGRELMGYRLRLADGTTARHSTLNWIDRDGRVSTRRPDQFEWRAERTWRSAATGAEYPVEFSLVAEDPETGSPRRLRFVPLADAQEIEGPIGGIAYWEGAGRVLDEAGREVGHAFLELTGYAGSLRERIE